MRLILAAERFDKASGGQAVWARGFAAWLRDQGHEVHAVATEFDEGPPGVAQHVVSPGWSPLRRSALFNQQIAALRPDGVHDSGVACWPDVFHPQTGSALHSLDRLIEADTPLRRLRAACSPKMVLLRSAMRSLEHAQVRAARRIVAVSSLVAQRLAAQHPSCAAKIVTVGNGVDTEAFVPRPGVAQAMLRIAAVAHNPMLKGLDTAMKSLRRLMDAGIPARLSVAGSTAEPAWRALASQLGVGHAVHFRGYVSDMTSFYNDADVLVHATRWDACSLATLEAMACGVPVVTTVRNGAADAIADGLSGFVVADPEDDAAIAARLAELADATRRTAMGTAARCAVLRRDLTTNYAAVAAVLTDR